MTVTALLGLSIRQDRDHIADRTADARRGIGEDVHDIAPLRFQGSLECCLPLIRTRDEFPIHALYLGQRPEFRRFVQNTTRAMDAPTLQALANGVKAR